MYHIFFFHSPVDGHLSCFHVLVIVSSVVMNTGLIVPFWIINLSRFMLRTVCVYAQLLSYIQLFVTPWTVALQAPLSMGISRQEYWSGLPCPLPGDLLDPRIQPASPPAPALQVDSYPWASKEASYVAADSVHPWEVVSLGFIYIAVLSWNFLFLERWKKHLIKISRNQDIFLFFFFFRIAVLKFGVISSPPLG